MHEDNVIACSYVHIVSDKSEVREKFCGSQDFIQV